MTNIPTLQSEDLDEFNLVLSQFLKSSEAHVALVTDKAGYLLAEAGQIDGVDTTSLSSLASGSFLATQAIAGLINEPNFRSIYQQGEKFSLLVMDIDESTVLIVIFLSTVSAGLVRYYSDEAIRRLSRQLEAARTRAPGESLDLATMNIADTAAFF